MHSLALANDAAPAAAPSRQRRAVLFLLGLSTIALLAAAWHRRPDLQGIVQLLPAEDPAVRLDTEITAEFGMQNPLAWVIVARRGTIWTRPALAHVDALTREVFMLPGVVATDVLSIASPNLRDIEVTDESLQPTYVMAAVPQSDEDVAALRRRVERNPNYNGIFVSRDGRAAMIVADFSPDVDAAAAGTAALALRDRHRDADTMVYVSGRPVIAVSVWSSAARVAAIAVALLAVGGLVLAFARGTRFLLAAMLAVALTVTWTLSVLVLLDAIVLPWTAFALLPALLLAIVFTAIPSSAWRLLLAVASGMLFGCLVLALLTNAPARALGGAMAVSVLAAIFAAVLARALIDAPPRTLPLGRVLSLAALVLVVAALAGLFWLRSSYTFVGYAGRYLPPAAASDVQAIAGYFPPPVALAARVRGEPGFVNSPAILKALDAVAVTAREDPTVIRAMSLADLVKIMNRVFNGDRPEYFVIPEDRAAVARYLTLGYSPNFRTFVDRAFSRTAVWVHLASEAPEDVLRVRARMALQLGAQLPLGATVDLAGGDGALIIVARSMVRGLAWTSAAGLVVAAFIIAIAAGPATGLRALVGGMLAPAVAGGVMGWTGVPIDLVSFPLLVAAGAVGSVLRALTIDVDGTSLTAVSLALAVMAAAALLIPYPGAHLVGSTFLGMALASLTSVRSRPAPDPTPEIR